MYCTRCGNKIDDAAKFCTACGAPVARAASGSPAPASTCAPEAPSPSATMPTVDVMDDPRSAWMPEPQLQPDGDGEARDASGRTPVAASAVADDGDNAPKAPCPSERSSAEAEQDRPVAPAPADSEERDTLPTTGPTPASPSASRPKRPRRLVVAAIAVVAVLACAAAVIFAARGGFSNGADPDQQSAKEEPAQAAKEESAISVDFAPRAAAYASLDSMAVSPTARVIPAGDDGAALASYTVRVKDAVDDAGVDIDISSVQPLEVASAEGFTIADLVGGALEPGTYYLSIERGDFVQLACPPLEVADDNPSEALGIARDPATPLGADTLFLAKLHEVSARYGEPGTELRDIGYEVHLSAAGLSYAEVMDFGDGVDRLLLVYNSGENYDANDVPNPESYNVEVWQYDAQADALSCCVGQDPLVHLSVTDTMSITSLANGVNIVWFEELVEGGLQMTYYGLDDAGSFRLLHTLVSTDEPDHTMILDGEDIGPADPDEVWDSLFTNAYQVGGRFVSFTNAFATMAEAQAGVPSDSPGIAVSGDGTYYPGQAVDLAASTVETLQGRVDALGASASGSAEDAPDAAGVSGSEVTETVAVPVFGDDADGESDTQDYTWGYLQLSFDPDAVDADIVARVNASLKKAYDTEKAATLAWAPGASATECLSYRSALTYNEGSVLGTRVQTMRTSWTGRPMVDMESVVYELETGDPIPIWEVANTSEEKLDAAAVDALMAYVKASPSGVTYASDDELRRAVEEVVVDGVFLLVPEGITIFVPEFALGYPYSVGAQEVVVWAFNDSSLVGTEVGDTYFME